MAETRIPASVVATVVAAGLGVAGLWLPWVGKRPVGSRDGQPIYTDEYVPGLETGFEGIDPFLVLLVVGVAGVAVVAHYRPWRPDGVLVGAGALILVVSGDTFRHYWSVDRYTVEPGLYLLLTSGGLLVLTGVGAICRRYATTVTDDSRDPRTG